MPPSPRADATLDAALLTAWPMPTDEGGDKFSRGTVLIIGGSPTTPGAVILAGMAALRMGAGRLQIATARTVAEAMAVAMPEALVMPLDVDDSGALSVDTSGSGHELAKMVSRADAVLIGSGMQSEPPPLAATHFVLDHAGDDAIIVADAAALLAVRDVGDDARRRIAGRLMLTPNRQEVQDLVVGATASSDPLVEVAERYGAVVTSFGTVQTSDGRRWHTDTGHPSLGTSGSGDVLAGLVLGAAARCGDAAHAACWATFVHAAAGRQLGERCGMLGFLARELIDEMAHLREFAQAPVR
jgi:ADP-dependent NAD(P)H-hydrate dehydratase